MIELLAHKVRSGDLYITQALGYLADQEWGKAKIAIDRAIAKGQLSNPDKAKELQQIICDSLGISFEGSTG